MSKIFSRDNPVNNVIIIIALIWVIFQVIVAKWMFLKPLQMIVMHGGFALVITYLVSIKKHPKKYWPWYFLMLALSIICIGYIVVNYENLIATKGSLSTMEIIMGVILFIVFWEATRESCGWVIPIMTLVFLAYVFLGQYMPHPFWHTKIPFEHAVSFAGIGLSDGVFGSALTVSANFVFLFMIFGNILQITKADDFFMEIAKIPGRYLAGGPAMTAVASSCLVGMVTGSGQANVAITGPFTIPLMKKVGYTPAQAGGIEAAASSGGSIMPPVMGIVAFVMAQYTGTPYVKLITMAIIPALLYYFCIGLFVHLQAGKLGIKIKETAAMDVKKALYSAPLFIVPMFILCWMLAVGYSLRLTVFYVVISITLIGLFRKESRGDLARWVNGLTKGAILGAEVAVVMGCVGAMISMMDLTGLLIKFPGIIQDIAGGNLFIMLFLTAVVTIILGCGLPPFASYLLVAMLACPALIKAGLVMMQAHFFVYFYAVFALITPPVGLACVVAAPICGATYLQTCWQAVKAGCVAWILPIMVVGAPVIILLPKGGPEIWLLKIIASIVLVFLLQIMLVGYFLKDTSTFDRVIAGIGALLIVFYVGSGHIIFSVGVLALLYLVIKQIGEKRLLRTRSQELTS